MRVSMLITDQMSHTQLEHSYLLCLALLNFEHQVNVVFVDNVFDSIISEASLKKQWLALKLFGVEDFLLLNSHHKHISQATREHCQLIDRTTFHALKNEMDLLL